MEQIAILTKLVQEEKERGDGEGYDQLVLNLKEAVRRLTIRVEERHISVQSRLWEAGREEREATKEKQRIIHEAWKKEQKNQRRRELYQLKNAEKKEEKNRRGEARKVANMIEEFFHIGFGIPKYFALWKAVWDNYE